MSSFGPALNGHGGQRAPDWLSPAADQAGLKRYLETVRERLWLVVLAVVVATGVAVLYVATTPKSYEAQASLLISPVSSADPTFAGLPVIRDSNDPTRDVETASQLVTTPQVARLAQQSLGSRDTPQQLLRRVSVLPVANSNIISITATGRSPASAARLANTFARAAVQDRTSTLHAQLDPEIARLRDQISRPGGADATLRQQLTSLQTLRASKDPTVSFTAPAQIPTSASAPKPKLSIAVGIIAGLVLGIGAAFAFQALDPRLRREQQLREAFRLPILARIPKESAARKKHGDSLAPQDLSPPTMEAYRSLRATVAALGASRRGSRSVLVTSPSAAEGKSTTAVNLASSLVIAGKRVILIEADLRRPSIARTLQVTAPHGIGSVLLGSVSLQEALITARPYGPYLQLLLADELGPGSTSMADRLSLPIAHTLIDEAKRLADYVIVDSPPLSEVLDALPLAQHADDVVLVVRLNKTPLAKLGRLGELLARHGITPAGFALVGVPQSSTDGYAYYAPAGSPRGSDAELQPLGREREPTA